MIVTHRRCVFCRALVTASLLLLQMLVAASVALGAIVATGNMTPPYPGSTDPWNVGGELIVGNTVSGSLSISAASQVTSVGGTIGASPAVLGSVTVTGADSRWTNSQDLLVGVFGSGQLDVLAGAQVTSRGASLGHIQGPGVVRVEGAEWLNSEDVFIGNGTMGSLTIKGGGRVTNRSAWIGLNTPAAGLVNIEETGSRWEIAQGLVLGDAADSGQASLNLSGGGSRLYIGPAAPARGAELDASETAVIVSALDGPAALSIYAGNELHNAGSAYLGAGVGETGSATIAGAGSAWYNAGEVAVGAGGTATMALSAGGTVSAGGSVSVGPLGTIRGNGTVAADLESSGTISPGLSAGLLSVSGNYAQSASGRLQVELFGSLPSQYDRLEVAGSAVLAGKLEVLLGTSGSGPFVPQLGHSFTILSADSISGQFSSLLLPALDAGLAWHVATGQGAVTLSVTTAQLIGDYNGDGVVNAADYTVWRDTLGSTTDLQADGDGSGMVSVADYEIWRVNFGASSPSEGALAAAAAIVPEPSTLLGGAIVLAVAVMALRAPKGLCRPRSRRRGRRPITGTQPVARDAIDEAGDG